jgi:hypothetical protein
VSARACLQTLMWTLIDNIWEIEPTDVTACQCLMAQDSAANEATQICEDRFVKRRLARSDTTTTEKDATLGLLNMLLAFSNVWSQHDQTNLGREVNAAKIVAVENIAKLIDYASQYSCDGLSVKSVEAVWSKLVQANGLEI